MPRTKKKKEKERFLALHAPISFAFEIFLTSCTNYKIKIHHSILPSTTSNSKHNLLRLSIFLLLGLSLMVPEIEKPRVTEIQVRMDCNGCVQKIRKALHGIHGIYEVYPDIAQQKLTVIGWADPEKIVKAIRKTRKIATICSPSEPTETSAARSTEQPQTEGGTPAPEAANPPPSEAPPGEAASQPQPQPEAAPPAEPQKDQPPPQNLQPEPAPPDANANQQQSPQPSGPKDVGEVHVICHHDHPLDYGHRHGYVRDYRGPWSRQYPNNQGNFYHCPDPMNRLPNSQVFHHEPPQPAAAFVTHSYNTYKSSPHLTEYEYVHSPQRYTHYTRIDHYNEDYHNIYSSGGSSSNGNGNGNITSIFSDENPNACRIM